jgi:hypothetical protein
MKNFKFRRLIRNLRKSKDATESAFSRAGDNIEDRTKGPESEILSGKEPDIGGE